MFSQAPVFGRESRRSRPSIRKQCYATNRDINSFIFHSRHRVVPRNRRLHGYRLLLKCVLSETAGHSSDRPLVWQKNRGSRRALTAHALSTDALIKAV
ncbi:hypothetical protein EVAR_9060_1 [Eumeta japonica]|uniref:Uncharacterized protein n=1 Tax=Eumeta variegata TaxID=151549 RepID=A0A4C1TWB6_EUMVA|nr:hypothetical protein EVAR_9060_1 [Eumeta japonica]